MAIAVAGAACGVFLILGLLVYQAVAASTAEQFDQMLQQQGALALRYADHEYDEGDTVVPPAAPQSGAAVSLQVVYQIATRANDVLYRSPGAPRAALAVGGAPGFASTVLEGRRWRVYTLGSGDTPLVVHIAEPLEYRQTFLMHMLRAVAVPLIFALVLLTVLIGVVTERAFRPVRRIAADLASRPAHDLSQVDTATMPVETHSLGVALNALLARQAEVLARERRFTADAAHELRTPLAALRVQAQVAARAASPAVARRALDKLQVNIDRTAHLMSQLLSLARVEPGASFNAAEMTEANRVIDLVLEDLGQAARDKQVEITVIGGPQCLPGSAEVLYLLIRNLLDNSIRHVGQRGRVKLEISRGDHCALLRVSDNGPGIPSAERERALQRFYRIPGSPSGGSGLGLSIVGRVVELIGGDIELGDPPTGTGLVATVRLPSADAGVARAAGLGAGHAAALSVRG